MMANSFRSPRRTENISIVMQQVQHCPWNPFNLREIATLERCLEECVLDDPRVGLIMRKLANESVFVEPARKIQHLARDDNAKRKDSSLMKQASLLKGEAKKMDADIRYFREKLINLSEHQQYTEKRIIQLKRSIDKVENSLRTSFDEFELLVERVSDSFNVSEVSIKTTISNFISSIPEFDLVKQLDQVPSQYRKLSMHLVKCYDIQQPQQQQLAMQASFSVKKQLSHALNEYLARLSNLLRDLLFIYKVYSTEIPEEIEYLKAFETHIEFLEEPLEKEAPKQFIVNYVEFTLRHQQNIVVGAPEVTEDRELGQVFSRISEWLKQTCKN